MESEFVLAANSGCMLDKTKARSMAMESEVAWAQPSVSLRAGKSVVLWAEESVDGLVQATA